MTIQNTSGADDHELQSGRSPAATAAAAVPTTSISKPNHCSNGREQTTARSGSSNSFSNSNEDFTHDRDINNDTDTIVTETRSRGHLAAFVSLYQKMRDGFVSLHGSPVELYYAYVLKFLDSYSYFSFSIIFTLFLSEDFNYSDITAGTLYGSWGALTTIYGLLTGFVIDNIGVSKSLRLGYALSLLARVGIFVTTSRAILLLHILVTLPLATCLGIPVLTTGIRRYTTHTNRGFAFGLFYVVMNVAALFSGPIVDMLTIWYKGEEAEGEKEFDNSSNADGEGSDDNDNHRWIQQEQHYQQQQNHHHHQLLQASSSSSSSDHSITWTFSSYRAIILTGIVANGIACIVTLWIREIKVQTTTTHGDVDIDDNNHHNCVSSFNDDNTGQRQISTTTAHNTSTMMIGSGDEPASMAIPPSPGPLPPRRFYGGTNASTSSSMIIRSIASTTATTATNVAAFRPLTGSPVQILRETCRSPSFRRFLLVCLIMLNVRMVFRHLDATLPKYMIREFGPDVAKGTIYAINPALIIILVPIVTAATSSVDPLVMMHYGSYISAASVFVLAFSTSIWACIVFVTVLSIGEAIWSPRLYDYSVSVCREGREGTYMALTSAPLFLAKLPVGALSGFLLQRYCPEDGERNSQIMWLIIGLLTATSPIFMTCWWGYISRKPNDEEEPDIVNYTELRTRPTVV